MLNLSFLSSLQPVWVWLFIIFSTVIVVLLIIIFRLLYLMHKRDKSLNTINQDLKNELTQYSQSEAAKEQLEKALLQNQKLQAIGTLASGIAHDFNNLLYAVNGYVEMAREDLNKDSIVYKNLGKVLDATKHGQDLIASILTFSRRQQLKFRPIYLQSTIESALAFLRPTIPAGVLLDFHVKQDNLIIRGDPTQIHQVIVNLINNAVDAMDSEGTITITIDRVSTSHVLMKKIPNMAISTYCKIEVTDTGRGMDQNTVERVFEPFFTTKEVGKGTGLGLSTVHTIVTNHQGEVMVKSRLGNGTTFTLLLPEFKENEYGVNLVSGG